MRLIDADELKERIRKALGIKSLDNLLPSEKTIVNQIDMASTIQPEPKRGKWIKYEQDFMLEGSLGTVQKTVRECSVCTAKIAGMVGIMNFCPNCGADMRGEQ